MLTSIKSKYLGETSQDVCYTILSTFLCLETLIIKAEKDIKYLIMQ